MTPVHILLVLICRAQEPLRRFLIPINLYIYFFIFSLISLICFHIDWMIINTKDRDKCSDALSLGLALFLNVILYFHIFTYPFISTCRFYFLSLIKLLRVTFFLLDLSNEILIIAFHSWCGYRYSTYQLIQPEFKF